MSCPVARWYSAVLLNCRSSLRPRVAAFLGTAFLFRGSGAGAIRCAVRGGGRGVVGVCVEYLRRPGNRMPRGAGAASRALHAGSGTRNGVCDVGGIKS